MSGGTGNALTSAGAVIYIGPAVTKTTDTAAKYAALSYVPIGLAETLGEYGDESASINFTSLTDSRVQTLKGPRSGGTVPLTVGSDPLDPGQIALSAAEGTKFDYAFKVVFPDRPNPTGTDSVEYFRAKVMSKRRNVGGASDVMRRSYPIAINSDVVEVIATMGA